MPAIRAVARSPSTRSSSLVSVRALGSAAASSSMSRAPASISTFFTSQPPSGGGGASAAGSEAPRRASAAAAAAGAAAVPERQRGAVLPRDAHDGVSVLYAPDLHAIGKGTAAFLVQKLRALALDARPQVQPIRTLPLRLGVVRARRGFRSDVRDGARQRGVLAVAQHIQCAGQVEQGRPGPRHVLVQPEQPIGSVCERAVVLLELP